MHYLHRARRLIVQSLAFMRPFLLCVFLLGSQFGLSTDLVSAQGTPSVDAQVSNTRSTNVGSVSVAGTPDKAAAKPPLAKANQTNNNPDNGSNGNQKNDCQKNQKNDCQQDQKNNCPSGNCQKNPPSRPPSGPPNVPPSRPPGNNFPGLPPTGSCPVLDSSCP